MAFRRTKKRKSSDGTAINWDPLKASPIFLSYYPYYVQLELTASKLLFEALKKVPPSKEFSGEA